MFFVFHFSLCVVCLFSCLSQSPTIDMGRAEPSAACVLCASCRDAQDDVKTARYWLYALTTRLTIYPMVETPHAHDVH